MNRAEYHATRKLIHELDARRKLCAVHPVHPGYNPRYEREKSAAALEHIASLRARIQPPTDSHEAAREERWMRLRAVLSMRIAADARRRHVEREMRSMKAWSGWASLSRLQQAMLVIDIEFGGKAAADLIASMASAP